MANRFLETNYYKSPFVKKLPGKLKSLYSYIICDCTPSGIWCLDLDISNIYTGFEVSFEEFKSHFILTGKAKEISIGKYFFPDFIEHQYPGGLSDTNKAHKNILIELRKFNLLTDSNYPKKEAPLKESLEGVLIEPLKGVQGNVLGNGQGNSQGNSAENEIIIFNTMPIHTDFNGLPEIYIEKSIEQLKIQRQVDLPPDKLIGMWEVFKVQNLTGKKHHPNKESVYSYFMNWIKDKKFENGTGNSKINQPGITKFNAGAVELLARGKQKFASITGQPNNPT